MPTMKEIMVIFYFSIALFFSSVDKIQGQLSPTQYLSFWSDSTCAGSPRENHSISSNFTVLHDDTDVYIRVNGL